MQESIVSGMGELHLEIYGQRLEREYGCPIILGKPKVSFRETLQNAFEFDYLHKRQSGGAGQYGRVTGVIEVEIFITYNLFSFMQHSTGHIDIHFQPLPPHENTKLEFVDKSVGTNVPKQYIPSIERGFKAMCEYGFLSGHRVSGIKFILKDGMHHCVDSSDYAFFLAAQGAMKDAFQCGGWRLLEPIMTVEVTVPSEFQVRIV